MTLELPGATPLRVVNEPLGLGKVSAELLGPSLCDQQFAQTSGAMFPKHHLWIARMSGDPTKSEDSQLQLLDTCLY